MIMPTSCHGPWTSVGGKRDLLEGRRSRRSRRNRRTAVTVCCSDAHSTSLRWTVGGQETGLCSSTV